MARDQRRLAAIVAADVVGYSRLMSLDESGTFASLKSHLQSLFHPKIAEYAGRVVKTTGDGLLLEFPSVVDAVRCAVDVQRAMAERNAATPAERRIDFRIGINVGDIIIDGDDIFGDGVNVAARLEALAPPGGICVSKVVRDHVLDKVSFEFESLGAQSVKNIPRPIEVYRIDLGVALVVAPPRSHPRQRRPRGWRASVAAFAVVLTGGLLFAIFKPWPDPHGASAAPAMSVGILPTSDRKDDGSSSALAERLMRNIATILSREGGWANYPRAKVVVLSEQGSDHRNDGGPHARYLLQGEMSRSDQNYVTNLRLIDATSRALVWSKRATWREGDIASESSTQLRKVSEELRSAVQAAETRRVMPRSTSDLGPMELVLRAIEDSRRDPTLKGTVFARSLVDRALGRQPDLIPALLLRSWLADRELDVDSDPAHRERIVAEYDDFTKRALDLDPNDPVAWDSRSTVLMYRGHWDAALEANATSLRLAPDKADFYASRVWLMNMIGQPAEALKLVDQALALEPDLINLGYALRVACEAYLLAGKPQAAITSCEKAAGIAKDDFVLELFLAAAYANAGDRERAATARTDALRIVPGFTIDQLRAKRYSDHPDYKRLAEKHWYAGLRSAGLADH